MPETVYTLVRYTGSRNLNAGHWQLLLDQLRDKRFISKLNGVGRMAGCFLKSGDLKLNPIGIPREWLWGIIIETERPLTERQAEWLRRQADAEGIAIDPNQELTLGFGILQFVSFILDAYGLTASTANTALDRLLENFQSIVEHEIRLAAADLLIDAGLPPAEATDFTVKQSIIEGRGDPPANIAELWQNYITGAGAALWDTGGN